MTGPRVRIEIDELVLHGFEHADRHEIADALRAELAGALAEWQPAGGRTVTHLDAGSFGVPPGGPPSATGRAIGQQVGRAIT
jgi:hypothetical protein